MRTGQRDGRAVVVATVDAPTTEPLSGAVQEMEKVKAVGDMLVGPSRTEEGG